LAYFACWRLAYNAGLGIVLKKQSESKWIVNLVKRKGWMKEGKVRNWIESELRAKMGKDYDFNVGYFILACAPFNLTMPALSTGCAVGIQRLDHVSTHGRCYPPQ
jgi:hypothetical protein